MSTEKTYFRPNKYIFVDFLRSKGICFLINLISAQIDFRNNFGDDERRFVDRLGLEVNKFGFGLWANK